jgi:hypothetical protein
MATQRNQPNQPTPNLNALNLRDEVEPDVPSDLPPQGGPGLPTLLPGTNIFRIPSEIAQLVEPFDVIDKDAQGHAVADPNDPTKAKVTERIRVKFDRDHPLVVVGGVLDGQPVATTISNAPRNRARKGEPPNPVSDMAYLLRESLQYKGPLTRNSEWVTALAAQAGKIFRAEHGLSAYCSPDRVRYINDVNDPTNVGSVEDPSGQKGCGKRLYTSAFKLPAAQGGSFSDIAYCPTCQAKLRGFFQIERFLKPTAAMADVEAIPF